MFVVTEKLQLSICWGIGLCFAVWKQ